MSMLWCQANTTTRFRRVLPNMRAQCPEQYFWNPAAIVGNSAGPLGGVCAGTIRRVTLGETGLSGVRPFLPVPRLQDDGTPTDEGWFNRSEKLFTEREWYGTVMKAARGKPCQHSECDTLTERHESGREILALTCYLWSKKP
jgi:hypothetical protein